MLVRSTQLARVRRIRSCCGASSKPWRIPNQLLEVSAGLLPIWQSGYEDLSHVVRCEPTRVTTACLLCIRNASGTLIGVVPLYLKSHSYGEYVFVRPPLLPPSVPALHFASRFISGGATVRANGMRGDRTSRGRARTLIFPGVTATTRSSRRSPSPHPFLLLRVCGSTAQCKADRLLHLFARAQSGERVTCGRQSCVPFTPVTGPRLLARGRTHEEVRRALPRVVQCTLAVQCTLRPTRRCAAPSRLTLLIPTLAGERSSSSAECFSSPRVPSVIRVSAARVHHASAHLLRAPLASRRSAVRGRGLGTCAHARLDAARLQPAKTRPAARHAPAAVATRGRSGSRGLQVMTQQRLVRSGRDAARPGAR